MLDFNNICIHGDIEWNSRKTEKVSSEYFEGAYPVVRCNIREQFVLSKTTIKIVNCG